MKYLTKKIIFSLIFFLIAGVAFAAPTYFDWQDSPTKSYGVSLAPRVFAGPGSGVIHYVMEKRANTGMTGESMNEDEGEPTENSYEISVAVTRVKNGENDPPVDFDFDMQLGTDPNLTGAQNFNTIMFGTLPSSGPYANVGYSYLFEFRDLDPNTTYYFRLVDKKYNTRSAIVSFKTKPGTQQSNSNKEGDGGPTQTTQPTGPVNGACGDANDSVVTSAPTANLCDATANTPSVIPSPTGGWVWTCTGTNNGLNDSCSATKDTGSGTTNPKSDKIGSGDGQSNTKNGDGAVTDTNQQPAKNNKLGNPLPYETIQEVVTAVINEIFLPIAIPFIVVMIMYSGFLFVVARRNGSIATYDTAKKTLKYTIIGATLTLGAFVIANALQLTLNSLLN